MSLECVYLLLRSRFGGIDEGEQALRLVRRRNGLLEVYGSQMRGVAFGSESGDRDEDLRGLRASEVGGARMLCL